MKINEKFREILQGKSLDLSSLDIKKVPRKRVSATALIPKRREHVPINAISQKFHIITRPQRSDYSIDLALNTQNALQGYDYSSTGVQRYFSKDYFPVKPSPKQEFPRIRQKIYLRPCKGEFVKEVEMVPYEKRIKTTTDLSILKYLDKSNSELRAKISQISQKLNKTNYLNENSLMSHEPEGKKSFSAMKNSKSEKSKLVRFCEIQKNYQKTEDIQNTFSETTKSKKSEKPSKVTQGVVDVSYPYCKSCKRDWFQSIDIQE
jgi:hypothetical protein